MADVSRTCTSCHTPLPVEAHFCLNCGTPTPTEPGVPPRTMPTGAIEVNRVRSALADRYRIERVLGEGGMATVYLAEDLKHHRKVAVKVMRPELAETLGADRFLREVEIAARMSHPNILPVHDSGAADGVLYYVMPLVEGESLPTRLAREKQLPVSEALRLAREVAEALAYAHKRGIIHRDIKPANILIHEGHALVADFGIARASSDAVALTKTGLAIGTPQYMSPEQASGDPNVDGRTDIYALGCVLYEMLAGEPPFTGPTAQAIITRSITEPPRSLSSTRESIPPALDSAVLKALAKSPADRYADASEMAAALDAAEHTGTVVSATSTPRISRSMVIAAAALVLVIGALAWKFFGTSSATGARSVAVLPFDSDGADDVAYFADGVVDEVRDRLSRLEQFTVIASSSADQYRGSDKLATDIARELRVDQVLMGKVRWAAASADGARRFRVSAELVDGQTGQVTWRDTFDGDLSDPFAVQGRIATRVASALGVVLNPQASQQLASRPTDNVEAYDTYLRAKAIPGDDPVQARTKIALLERTVALDSSFVSAWGELALTRVELYSSAVSDPITAREVGSIIDRMQRIAPDSTITHLVAANYRSNVMNDIPAARSEINRAMQLSPRDVTVLTSASTYDMIGGDFQGMFDKLQLAREIDPRSQTVLVNLLRAQTYLGRCDDALDTAAELLALGNLTLSRLQFVTQAHLCKGDLAGARQVVQDLLKTTPAAEVASFFAGFQEMAFLLGDRELELLYRLPLSAFDNDLAWWGQALSNAAWQQGDTARARVWADSSLTVAFQQIAGQPDNSQLRVLNAVSLAYLGRKAEALREAESAMADTVGSTYNSANYVLLQYVRVLLATGEDERALDELEVLVDRPYYVKPGYLRTDPMFRPLDGNPRFERLANRGVGTPRD